MARSLLVAAWRENRAWPIFLTVLLALNIGLFAWISYGFSPKVEAVERRYIAAQADARQIARQKGPASLRELYERAGNDLQTFRQAIPGRSEFTGLIGEVFALAGEAGLTLDRVAYAPTYDKETDLLRYGLSFSVAGNYGQIKRFIAALEQSSRIIAIEQISLSSAEREGATAVSLNIRLLTYFKSEGA